MNRPLLRYVLSCLCLMVVWVSAISAQPAPLPTPPRVARAWLDLRFDRRGGVQATLRLPFQPPDPELWRNVLGETLRTPPDLMHEEPSRWSWSLHARADAALRRRDWSVEGAVDWTPLRNALNLYGVGQLSVSVEHPSADFSDCSLDASPSWHDILSTHYRADVPVALPSPPLRLAFGHQPANAWRFLPLVSVLMAPIAVTLWRLSRPRGSADDRFTAWFRYWRFHGWVILALWCAWLAAVATLDVVNLAGFLLCGVFRRGELVWLMLFVLLPPALSALICKVLSAPAFARVPEVGWTRGRLFKQALWGQLGVVAVGVCVVSGGGGLTAEPSSLWAWMSFIAAAGLLLLCVGGWFQSRSIVLDILPSGELRKHLFELADEVQVPVRQAYLMPAAHWRLLNVVGAVGECVHITAEVLPHLSRREVDALLAVELARLWRRRRRGPWRILALFLPVLVFSVAGGLLAAFGGGHWAWLLLPFFLLLGPALRFRRGWQHFAPALNRHALAMTGDPEALITALAKLRRLQLLPLVAGQKQDAPAGAPADWPRLRDLADRAGIPPERLEEILGRPGSGEDRYAPLPAAPDIAADADSRVFSRDFKRRSLSRQSWTGLALEIATPALMAYLVQLQQWRGVWLAVAYLAGLPLTVWLRRLGVSYVTLRSSLALRRGIRDKLVSDGLKPDAWGGIFVGLSPHAEPRNYENFLSWDLGFLLLAGDRLCYVGDRTRFALERGHIKDVYLGPGAPGWRTAKRVYVAWQDDARGVGGTFNLTMSEARSLWRRGPSPAKLARRLRDWLEQPAASADVPRPLRELSGPDFGAVASESLAKLAAVNILLALLLLRAPFAIGISFLLGLSFEPEAEAGGWYVLVTVALLQVWTVLSFVRYRGGQRDDADADAVAHRSD